MSIRTLLFSRRRIALWILLVVGLASIMMLTYSGRIESGDTRRFVDALNSGVRYGDWKLDETFWFTPPELVKITSDVPAARLEVQERLSMQLAIPLYRLADILPGLGYVHTVWLFNVIVSALAGGVLFWYLLALDFDDRTAIVISIASVILTVILPYSKTFFRGPLVLLLLLLAALFLHLWRRLGYKNIFLPLAALLVLFLASQTKSSFVFALPGLLIMILPNLPTFGYRNRLVNISDVLLVGMVTLVTVTVYSEDLFNFVVQLILPILETLRVEIMFVRNALHTYLFSIGGSVWGTSPIILLAFPGIWMLLMGKRRRLAWGIILILLGYTFGHALFSGSDWFGGSVWPPRFLLPTIPFLMVGIAPVFEKVWESKRRNWLLMPIIVLVAYSLWVQFIAVALPWQQYDHVLPPEADGLFEWLPGLNHVSYLRWVLLPPVISDLGVDFAWARVNRPLWALAYSSLAGICFIGIRFCLQAKPDQISLDEALPVTQENVRDRIKRILQSRFNLILLPILWIVITILGLRTLYQTDEMYWANKPALFDVLDVMDAESKPDEFLLLADDTYERFMMNYNGLLWPRILTLPSQPGEAASDRQPAVVTSTSIFDLLTATTQRVIHQLASKRDTVWLLTRTGPYTPWSARPVEQFMMMYYYPLHEIQLPNDDPTVRLMKFDMSYAAPDPFSFREPESLTDLRFDDSIQLTGFTMPGGTSYHPGDSLPITLYWETDETLDRDYVIASFLVDSEAGVVIVQGADSPPQGGFAPTTAWQPGLLVQDNRAMHLPENLAPGTYQLWLAVYYWDGEAIRLPVSGTETVEGTLGVLPPEILVVPEA